MRPSEIWEELKRRKVVRLVDPEVQLQDDLFVAKGSAAEELPQGDAEAG